MKKYMIKILPSLKVLFPFLVLFYSLSCSKPKETVLAFDDVIPVIIDTGNTMLMDRQVLEFRNLDLPGVMDVKVWNDYLLFSTQDPSGYIKVINKNSKEPLGSFILHGNGPDELLDPTPFSDFCFDKVLVSVNNSKGRLIYWDIKASCEEGHTICVTREDNLVLNSGYLSSIIPVSDETLACVEIVNCGQNRFLYREGERIILPSQQRLNEVKLTTNDGFRFNMLFGFAVYNKERHRMVEASAMLNTIQLYSVDDDFARTICIGRCPDDVSAIEKLPLADLPMSFQSLRAFEQGFGILFFGTTLDSFEQIKTNTPIILLFDWNGQLMDCYNVPVWISSFDIDWDNKVVYGVDYDEEKVYQFSLL